LLARSPVFLGQPLNQTQVQVSFGSPPLDALLGTAAPPEWVIDQYQVSQDKRGGIKSYPNRPEAPEYIAGLVARVVLVP
jgi:predicted helicase